MPDGVVRGMGRVPGVGLGDFAVVSLEVGMGREGEAARRAAREWEEGSEGEG